MIPFPDLLLFIIAAFGLVITPGPNMIYLISRSITQGRQSGIISLLGVICGFLFHISKVAFGLTALLFAVPFALAWFAQNPVWIKVQKWVMAGVWAGWAVKMALSKAK